MNINQMNQEDLDLMQEMEDEEVLQAPTTLVLTGAYYGRTIKLRCGGGFATFTNGKLILPPAKAQHWDGVKVYLEKCYQVFEEGSKKLLRNQARDRVLSREYVGLADYYGETKTIKERAGMANPFSPHAARLRERAEKEGVEIGQRDIQASPESGPTGPDGGNLQPQGSGPGSSPASDGGPDDASGQRDSGVRADGAEQPGASAPKGRTRAKSPKA